MLRLTLVCALVLPVHAQFSEVVSTDDGQQVYFTSPFALKTIAPPTRPFSETRAYRVNAAGVELFIERGDLARTDGGAGSNDGVRSLQISGDGQSAAFTLTNICPPGEACTTTIQRAEVRGPNAQVLGEGTVWLSRNGEWALLNPPPFSRAPVPGQPPVRTTEATLINLRTQQRTQVPLPGTDGNPLASDGTVFVNKPNTSGEGSTPGFLNGTEFQPLDPPPPGPFHPLALSDNGRKLFFTAIDPPPAQPRPPRLMVRDVETGADAIVHPGGNTESPDLVGISNDGQRALIRLSHVEPDRMGRIGPAIVAYTDTGTSIELPLPEGEQASTGTISGSGNAAFVFTDAGRLLRFELSESGTIADTRELLPPTPYVCCGEFRGSPGEVLRLEVNAPGVSDWAGRVTLGSMPLLVLSSAPGVTVQIPWEVPSGLSDLLLDIPSTSPFVVRQPAFVSPAQPRFVPADPGSNTIFGGIKVVLGDFSGPLTTQPGPGEIIHIYMTGLGPVVGAMETGKPAPVDDVRPIVGHINCRFSPHTADAETLFAGLAPGTIGYYQVSFRMPSDAGSATLNGLRCQFQSPGFTSVMSYQQLAPPAP